MKSVWCAVAIGIGVGVGTLTVQSQESKQEQEMAPTVKGDSHIRENGVASPKCVQIAPYFIVPDVARAARYYEQNLGFHCDPPLQSITDFAFVKRDGVVIMLRSVPGVSKSFPNSRIHPEAGWDTYIWVSDARGLYEEFQKRGARIHKPIETMGTRLEFEVEDLNGYVLAIGQI